MSLLEAGQKAASAPTYWTAVDAVQEVKVHIDSPNPLVALLNLGYTKSHRRPFFDAFAPESVEVAPSLQSGLQNPQRTSEDFVWHYWECPASNRVSGNWNKSLKRLEDEAEDFCTRNKTKLEEWADRLVDVRRRRAHTLRWESYVGFRRVCSLCQERLSSDPEDLEKHFTVKHPSRMSQQKVTVRTGRLP